MFDLHDDPVIDKDKDAMLERLRQEVACLAMNLETIANRPEIPFVKARMHNDDHAELFMSFSHEPHEPIESSG